MRPRVVVTDGIVIDVDDPEASDVRSLVETHLAFARRVTPPEDVHAVGVEGLLDPAVTVFSARRAGHVVGVGALRELDEGHGEVKSMHTRQDMRGQGVGRAIVEHLVAVAHARGYRRLSLETGTMEAFAASRALYEATGFEPCPPFGEHEASPNSVCMTRHLGDDFCG